MDPDPVDTLLSSGSIAWGIAEKMRKAGYDTISSLAEAKKIIREFLDSDKTEMTYGIMGAGGKCVDTVTLQRAGGASDGFLPITGEQT